MNLKQQVARSINAHAVKLQYDARNHTSMAFYDELANAAILAVAEWLDGEVKRLDEAASGCPNYSVSQMMASRAAHCEAIAQLLREEGK